MDEDPAVIERRIAATRQALSETASALAYQADIRHRVPEYAEHVFASAARAASTEARTLSGRALRWSARSSRVLLTNARAFAAASLIASRSALTLALLRVRKLR